MIELIDQPISEQLGTILKEKLSGDKYKHFVIVSAFAKNSGVLRMKDSLQKFRASGGRIEAFIGLDAHGTSYEAVVNLFQLVDELYIIHDSNLSITFHSKIYYLSDMQDSEWLSVGSSNLTGGGLWTNYETNSVVSIDLDASDDTRNYLKKYKRIIERYKDGECSISMKIKSVDDLKKLLKANLLCSEIQLQMGAAKARRPEMTPPNTSSAPFGSTGKANIPSITDAGTSKRIKLNNHNIEITSILPIAPTDHSEKMWFETREMTGGSRNILDLSMLGVLVQGTGDRTRYQTDKNDVVLGSVVFFDVNPSNITAEKNVTINYNAKDYVGCTIKMHQTGANPNGSWRIQLKGETAFGEKLTTAQGDSWLVHKIIVLEKIRTDYYAMSVLPESEIEGLKSHSIFVARNGRTKTSKQYGLLDI